MGEEGGLGKSCISVIVLAGAERFAFKGVASDLVTYLTDVVKLSNSTAAKLVNIWVGVSFMLPLLGAFLADSVLGRYSIIFASSLLYVLGLVALTATSFLWELLPSREISCGFLFLSLFLISSGQGGYNPCLQAYGVQQIKNDEVLPQNRADLIPDKKKSAFFKWWYFGVCAGSLLGLSCMGYLQDTVGWGLGFAIPTVAMTVSVLPLLCGNTSYADNEPNERRNECIQNLIKAIKMRVANLFHGKTSLSAQATTVSDLELEEKPLCKPNVECQEDESGNVPSDMSIVLSLMPIWAVLLVFAIVFQQPSTFFTKQGLTMKRNIGKFLIPPASLQSAINISVLLFMPFYEKIVIPVVRIFTGDDRGLNVTQRMGFGLFFSTFSMISAALVETMRLELSTQSGSTDLPEGTVPLSIFWLLPQYVLLGLSDVFTVVGMQEFFYTEVPNNMKTVGMALHLSVFGVGSFLSALLTQIIEYFSRDGEGRHSWFSDDMTKAHLDKFYSLLGLLSALSLISFMHFSKCYSSCNTYKNVNCK